MSAWLRARQEPILALLALTAAVAALFWPVVWGALAGAPRFFEWDVPEQYWPDLVMVCDGLSHGDLPWWNPYDRGGYPFWQDPQTGAWQPVNWGICALSGGAPGLGWATARVVFYWWLGALFGLGWLRRLGLSWASAILGSMVLVAAPFMRHNWELNLTWAMAWLPAMLWAAERAVTERRAYDAGWLALAIAGCAWVGSPPALWLASTWTAAYIAVRLATEARANGRQIALRATAVLALAAALAAALIAIVVLPGLELAGQSVQAGRSYADLAEGHLRLHDLQSLLWPQAGNHLYVGLLPLLLAPFALANRRPIALMAAISLPLAAAMALGPDGPLFGLAWSAVPGVHLFRLPHRYEAWMGPAAALLVGIGLDELSRRLRPRVSAAHLLRHAAVGAALVPLLLLDLTRAMPDDRHTRGGEAPCSAEQAEAVLDRVQGVEKRWRVFDEFGIGCRSGTRLHLRDLRGYQDPLILASHERVVANLRKSPALAAQFNVRYALTGPHFIHDWDRHYLPPPDELERDHGAHLRGDGVVVLDDPLPFAYWVPASQVEVHKGRSEALTRTVELAPAPIAVLETPPQHIEPGSAPAKEQRALSAAIRLRLSASALSFQVQAPSPGVVVVNEAWYPGWRATVDGEPAPILRANGFVRAIEVGEGEHEIAMSYRPAWGVWLRWLWALGWVCTALVLSWGPLRRSLEPRDTGASMEPHR